MYKHHQENHQSIDLHIITRLIKSLTKKRDIQCSTEQKGCMPTRYLTVSKQPFAPYLS